jgi:hypothetical protein
MIDAVPAGFRARLGAILEPAEMVTHVVAALGATAILTDRRLIVAREGAPFRPRTGFRTWAFEDPLAVRVGLVRHATGSLLIESNQGATSLFIGKDQWADALRLVGALRRRVRRASGREQGPS